MPVSPWAAYLMAYRRRHGITQSGLAAKLGVSPPTVSRWESGLHVPDLESEKAIRDKLGGIDTNTETEWVYRVGATRGVEFLISRERGIISASASARLADTLRSVLVASFVDVMAVRDAPTTLSKTIVQQMGLYDGSVRALQFATDLKVDGVQAAFLVDAWPVLTTDENVLVHAVAYSRSDSVGATSLPVRDLIRFER